MQMSTQDQVCRYSISDEGGRGLLFSAQTDLTNPVALDARNSPLERTISMLAQPHALIKGGEISFYRFDLRFEDAALKSVPVSGTIHPGFLPLVTERTDFSIPRITDAEFGAFFLETTFMNRLLIACSPDHDPTLMSVSEAQEGKEVALDGVKTPLGADHSKAA